MQNATFTLLISLLFSQGVFAETAKRETSELIIDVSNVRSGDGHLAFAVFDESGSKEFPRDPKKAVLTKLVDAKKGTSEIKLGSLPKGRYAVSLLHDENRDGQMNFHFFGMPKEGFGFSKDPRIAFGPPDFGDCVVQVEGPETRVPLKAKYF